VTGGQGVTGYHSARKYQGERKTTEAGKSRPFNAEFKRGGKETAYGRKTEVETDQEEVGEE